MHRLRRLAIAAGLLCLLALPAGAETRLSVSVSKSFHPTDEDFATFHPSVGVDGRLWGEWLSWRAGAVLNSQSALGPYAGLSATLRVFGDWRVGIMAGAIGNYPRGSGWWAYGAMPIVQWRDQESGWVWEFGAMSDRRTTVLALGFQVPFRLFWR